MDETLRLFRHHAYWTNSTMPRERLSGYYWELFHVIHQSLMNQKFHKSSKDR